MLDGLNPEALAFWGMTAGIFALFILLARIGNIPLWLRVILGLIAGGAAGFMFPQTAPDIKIIGDAFVRLIRMLVVPLIFTTLVAGIVSMGDPKRLGALGLKTMALYMITTMFAVTFGLILGTLIIPGQGIEYLTQGGAAAADISGRIDAANAAGGMSQRLLNIIPSNPVAAMVNADVLGIIFFSILFGIGILSAGEKGDPVGRAIESAAEAILKMTVYVMALAPFGVYALMAWVLGTQGLGVLVNLGKLAIALYIGCLIQMTVVYGGIIRLLLGLPVTRFFKGILDAMATAFSTASSAATLPVTISNLTRNLGVDRSVAGSVLPLGATINMDGTSIYLGLVALFAAQALGIDLTLADYITVGFTAVLMSIGSAGIPSAGLFLSVTLLSVIGITPEQAVLIVAFIFPFDRILDMMRTMTNVSGDAAVAVTVGKWEGALDEEIFRGGRQ